MRGIAVVFLLTVMMFAGCIEGEEPDPVSAEDEEEPSETTGRIAGQVVRDDFEVVPEAEVYLIFQDDLVDDTITDEEGLYAFEDVESGDYRIRVADPCCEDDLQTVRVTAGATVEHNPQLTFIPEPETWVDTSGYWEGFLGCSLNVLGQPWTCPDENSDTEERIPIQPGLKSIIVWMEWDATPISTTEELRHWLYIPADESRATIRHQESSPLEYRVDHTDEISLPFDEIEEETEILMRVWGSSEGIQYTHQQAFTVYYHLFYGESAPSGYSAQPDS